MDPDKDKELVDEITPEDVLKAVTQMKNGRTHGQQRVRIEHIRLQCFFFKEVYHKNGRQLIPIIKKS